MGFASRQTVRCNRNLCRFLRKKNQFSVKSFHRTRLTPSKYFFLDITAKEFMELRGKQRSRYDLLNDFLSEMLSVPAEDINIFSLMDKRDRMLDIRFAVYTGLSFLRSEKIHGYLAAHKQKVGNYCCTNIFSGSQKFYIILNFTWSSLSCHTHKV